MVTCSQWELGSTQICKCSYFRPLGKSCSLEQRPLAACIHAPVLTRTSMISQRSNSVLGFSHATVKCWKMVRCATTHIFFFERDIYGIRTAFLPIVCLTCFPDACTVDLLARELGSKFVARILDHCQRKITSEN